MSGTRQAIDGTEIDLELGLPKLRQLLTVKETAEYIRCNEDHVYHLLDSGELHGENHSLKTDGETKAGRNRPRYIRINRASAIAYRRRRRIRS